VTHARQGGPCGCGMSSPRPQDETRAQPNLLPKNGPPARPNLYPRCSACLLARKSFSGSRRSEVGTPVTQGAPPKHLEFAGAACTAEHRVQSCTWTALASRKHGGVSTARGCTPRLASELGETKRQLRTLVVIGRWLLVACLGRSAAAPPYPCRPAAPRPPRPFVASHSRPLFSPARSDHARVAAGQGRAI
jgi:hypothetical protein